MKRIIKKTACILLAGIMASCSDDFLGIKPLSIYTPESIYINAKGFEGVMVTLRKNLRVDFYGNVGGIGCELIASDMAVGANKEQNAIHNFDTQVLTTGTGSNYDFHEIWGRAYNQVRNANVALSRIDQGEFNSDEEKNAIIAEAYFHRAYWYYRLVHLFGDVPFLNKEHTAPKIDFYTHSRQTILDKIAQDMEFAVEWLPEDVVPGAIPQGAGYHLLAKIYLASGRFSDAAKAASDVIGSGKYELMKSRFGKYKSDSKYNVIWDLHQKENKSLDDNREALIVVQDRYGFPSESAEVGGGTSAMRKYVPSWWQNYILDPDKKRGMIDTQGNPLIIQLGRGVGYVRATYYHNYIIWTDGTDLRHDSQVNWWPVEKFYYNNPTSSYYGQPVTTLQTSTPVDTIHCWYPFPYYKVYVEDEERPEQPYGGHSDWYLYRLAETYLLRAEAYFWQGDLDKAMADLNEVRGRANAELLTDPSDVTIEYILDERARELFAEEFRKSELTRIAYIMAEKGLNGYSLSNFSTKNYWYDRVMAKNEFYRAGNILWGPNIFKVSPFHILWPIPSSAISTNVGGVINQNEGYVGTDKNQPPLTVIDDSQ